MLLSWAIDLTSIAEETKKSILTGSFIILYLLTGVNLSQSVRRKVAYHIDTKYSAVAYWLLWPLLYPILLLRYGTHKMLG